MFEHHFALSDVIRRVRTLSNSSRSRSRSNSCGSVGSRGSHGSANIHNHGEFKVLVIGAPGVGKTTICRTYAGLRDEDDDICCVNSAQDVPYDTSVFLEKETEIQQYDLEVYDYNCNATSMEKRSLIEKCDAYLLVYSTTSKQSFLQLLELKQDITRIVNNMKGRSSPAIMFAVGNMSDLRDNHVVKDDELWSLNVEHVDISAVNNEGLQLTFNTLVRKCADRKESQQKKN